jgi:hypothetical protein
MAPATFASLPMQKRFARKTKGRNNKPGVSTSAAGNSYIRFQRNSSLLKHVQ